MKPNLQAHFEGCARRLMDGGEKLLPLGKACQFLNATRGEHVSTSTLCRWILRGKSGVRLDAVRLNGNGWQTSREALSRFAAALSAIAAGQALEEVVTPSVMEKRAEQAKAEMNRKIAQWRLERKAERKAEREASRKC